MESPSPAVRCPDCGHESAPDAIFCQQCGRGLGRRCNGCGTTSAATARFCRVCGARLADRAEPRPSGAELVRLDEHAERRQLTVMFCDMVGSTPLAAQLDPEDYRVVLKAFLRACTASIERFDGHVAQHLGDGVVAYFGYPIAREDSAQRAVRAALEIVPAVRSVSLADIGRDGGLEVRVGIHTGGVVIDDRAAVGDVPNVAARLQTIAAPNTVVVSEATHRLVAGFFAHEDLGPQTLKGVADPVRAYRVTGPTRARSRFELAMQAGFTPLVGRRDEHQFLCSRWEMVKAGAGQVMSVSGEPGIGKSRLLQSLAGRLTGDEHLGIEFRCAPTFENSALHPIIENLHRMLRTDETASPEAQLQRLEAAFATHRYAEPDAVPLVAALLSLPQPTGHLPLAVSPERQRERTLDTLVGWVIDESERQPVRLTIEDLHWADPSTLEFIDRLIHRAGSARIYLLLTFRPEFVPTWAARSHVSHVSLARLNRDECQEMVERLTADKPLPVEVVRQIASKTDGVPLFVEELTKMVLEAPWLEERDGRYVVAASRPLLSIPTTLRDSLAARLDQLGPHRDVAQIGSCLGREFSYELIRALVPGDDGRLGRSLHALVDAELLHQHGDGVHARYTFKHAMVRDAAYESLLKSRRQQYHHAIATILTGERFAATEGAEPELVAHHYTAAGMRAEAIPHWLRAGQGAAGRAAHAEAIQHYRTALALVATLPAERTRLQLELGLQVSLATSLASTQGYAAPDVETTYARALELCRELGEGADVFPILRGLSEFYMVRNDQLRARELAEDCVRIATETDRPEHRIEADAVLGYALSYLGEFEPARRILERGLGVHQAHAAASLPFVAPQNPGISFLVILADVLFWLGYPDEALRRMREALALAETLQQPFDLTFVHIHSSLFHQMRREPVEAERYARIGREIAAANGFGLWVSCANLNLGIAEAALGRPDVAIPMLERELVVWAAAGAESTRTYYLAGLAGACHVGGRLADAQRAVDEGIAIAERPSSEHMYEALLYWLRGEIRLSQSADAHAEAAADFRRAIALAQRQRARSLELRATMALCRLLRRRGSREEARALLQPLYEWFTEGFDTPDLRDARALLAKLSA
jgi:class 3 adenylate cyclase/tetratricopeptide (TPR) repeat protein